MSVLDWIVLVVLFILPFVIVIWAYFKRKRIFYNMHYPALVSWMNFQNESKYLAMEQVLYQQEEEEEDEAGEDNSNSVTQ